MWTTSVLEIYVTMTGYTVPTYDMLHIFNDFILPFQTVTSQSLCQCQLMFLCKAYQSLCNSASVSYSAKPWHARLCARWSCCEGCHMSGFMILSLSCCRNRLWSIQQSLIAKLGGQRLNNKIDFYLRLTSSYKCVRIYNKTPLSLPATFPLNSPPLKSDNVAAANGK